MKTITKVCILFKVPRWYWLIKLIKNFGMKGPFPGPVRRKHTNVRRHKGDHCFAKVSAVCKTQSQGCKEDNVSLNHQENGERAARLMACIGVTSLIGRLIFGFVSDLPLVRRNGNRIVLQQVTLMIARILTMVIG